jgi:homoserine kinase
MIDELVGRSIAVPGSTSNLGPGFDALGLALDLELRLRIVSARDDGRGDVDWRFSEAPPAGENAIDRAYRAAVGAGALPSLAIEVTTDIPIRAGLGSSAAAFVAGLRLGELVRRTPQPIDTLLRAACDLEGHPDNTSASLLGGFVVSCRLPDGRVIARATPWPRDWLVVVATPKMALETKVARAALPATVPLQDAVVNVQRTALLVLAVQLHDATLLRSAFDDRLHQPHRAALVPGLAEALAWRDSALLGTFLSGAGPSIAAVVDTTAAGAVDRIHARFADLYRRLQLDVAVRPLRARAPL